MKIEDIFCCPNCCGELNPTHTGFQCSVCLSQYDNREGIPSFIPEGLRTDYSLIPHHHELNQLALEIGWKNSVIGHIDKYLKDSKNIQYAHEYIISEARGDFQFLLPINKDSIILEIGSGWGNITSSLARVSKHVFAVDTNLDNLHFVKLRADQEGLNNITAIQGDACTLPVKGSCIDAVIMVGVLEWVAWGRNGKSPHYLQRETLNIVNKALKTKGCLYLAIENRFNFKYFLGVKEPNTNLRFISIPPYQFGNKYSRLMRKKEFREVTYSQLELRKLLKSVGFNDLDFFYPIPNYQNFRYLSRLENRITFLFLIKMLASFPKFSPPYYLIGSLFSFLPKSIIHFFWPNFCVIASKP